MAITKVTNIGEAKKGNPSSHLLHAIHYIMNPDKTKEGLWVGSNCGINAQECFEAMMATKKDFGKLTGRQGYHFVISFAPGEQGADEETAFALGRDFCQEYLGDAYDYCYAVHDDHAHMHIHIIFNSVDRLEGYKYRYLNGDWEKRIQPITDKLCRKYSLQELAYDKGAQRKGKSYAEHAAQKGGKWNWKQIIRADIDDAICRSSNMDDFFAQMHEMGYQTRLGHSKKRDCDYVSYHPPYADDRSKDPGVKERRSRRDYLLGDGYTYADVKRRIALRETMPRTYVVAEPMKRLYYRSLHVPQSRFQVCAVRRIKQAYEFHFMDLRIKEQARVRKDLLAIDRLTEECSFLLDHNIKDLADARTLLDEIKRNLIAEKHKQEVSNYIDQTLTQEERDDRARYISLAAEMELHEADLSDEEFEAIADEMDFLEQKYDGVTFFYERLQDGHVLEKLKSDKRILNRIIKRYEETMSVREVPYRIEILKKMDQEKIDRKEAVDYVPESGTQKGGV